MSDCGRNRCEGGEAVKLTIRRVANPGDRMKERLVLVATQTIDVGDFAVLQTGVRDGEVTIDVYNTYWFQNKEVDAGDLVVLYTKAGTNRVQELPGGKKVHFIYWGLDAPIWAEESRAAVLLHAPEWVSKVPGQRG
jgi:hypothetical protein